MSTKVSSIAVIGVTPSFNLSPSGLAEQAKALEIVKAITLVDDEDQKNLAIAAVSEAKAFTKQVEGDRTSIKAPILEAGKAIDAIAKSAADPVLAEVKRVEKLVADYQQAQFKKLEDIRRQQREEQDRLAQIQRQREAAEAALAAATTAKAQASAARAVEQVRAAEGAAKVAAAEALDDVVNAKAPEDIKGGSFSHDFEIQVVDAAALYKAFPGAVDLVPKLSIIKNLLKGGIADIPGVTYQRVAKVAVRSAKRPDPALTVPSGKLEF